MAESGELPKGRFWRWPNVADADRKPELRMTGESLRAIPVTHACGTQTFKQRILDDSLIRAGVAFNYESGSALRGRRPQWINDVPPTHPAIGPRWCSQEYRDVCRSLICATFVKTSAALRREDLFQSERCRGEATEQELE
jgi:hypothetical protein